MICSSDEGISLLRKWEKEGADLRCVFWRLGATVSTMPWIVQGKCWVHEASNKLVLGFSDEAACRVLFSSVAKFEFGTPLDVEALSSELLKYSSWLSIYLSDGLVLMIAEKKDVIDHAPN